MTLQCRPVLALSLTVSLALATAACHSADLGPLPSGPKAYDTISLKVHNMSTAQVINVNDRLSIRILGEPELTSDNYRVDANGAIQMPLAGEMIVAGRTPDQVRDLLIERLGKRYLRQPQIAVIVLERAKSTFTVEGAVREPGVYEVSPNLTLLSALALAKSPSDVARLDGVMIFRDINGERAGARFNLAAIRKGEAADPQVLAGDKVVVVVSNAKNAWRQFLQAVPAFNLFYIFR